MVGMTHVTSSNLAAVGYDASTQQLYIKFNHGGTYVYSGVPEDVHQALMEAGSKGTFFHYNIKTAGYPYQKL
ncbi:KTSC domain-containing protein [uncultured Pseudodesulfovibrio sp.]|uniref:KTSC domain-containing protein n=1 Tax=uncultured Pseudodesulfovibrio sp. TaxID=2035858 RepID=UPI0029C68B0E|nr:KTSC domain-containing protein [uncultured Pseudodesulfovibrio sp.]